jgi:hypothetical protein
MVERVHSILPLARFSPVDAAGFRLGFSFS